MAKNEGKATHKGMENLRSVGELSTAEARAISSKGGVNSGKARRKYRAQRELIREMLILDATDDTVRDRLRALDIDPSIANAALFAISGQAQKGDVESMRYLRDTVGERPAQGVELGGMDDQPIQTMDLTKLTDAQLQRLAAKRAKAGKDSPDDTGKGK